MPYFIINDVLCEVNDQDEDINKLLESDDRFTYNYIKTIKNSDFKFERARVQNSSDGLVYESFPAQQFEDSITENISAPPLPATPNLEEIPTDTTDDNVKWTLSATKLLITTRLAKEERFTNGSSSKKTLWNKISSEMQKNGYSFDGDSCDRKFRGLMATYKRNAKRKSSTGESSVTWPFFNEMDEVYGVRANINIPKERLLSSSSSSLSTPGPSCSYTSDENDTPTRNRSKKTCSSRKKTEEEMEQEKIEMELLEKKIKLAEDRNKIYLRRAVAAEVKNDLLKELISVLKKEP